MKMVILSADWKVKKAHLVAEIISDSYASLLLLTHDTIILCEGLTAFARLNSQLEDKVQTANAQAEVTEELLYTVEEQEKKNQEKITLLEARLASLEIQQKKDKEFKKLKADYQKEMESGESALNEERGKRQKAEKSTQEMKDELSTIETQAQKAASRALIEFRESKEYEDELVKGSTDAYQLRFKDCEKAISRLQPKLDLSGLQADNLPDKEGSKSDKKADAMEDHPLSS
ncbi:uncharacterized protein [Elaeis guineensis]|uniref:uncharacterized protein isoform X2 n=1 Tax=Elaeis guineensis var. tenera TaxID=51953 RepID=UPI003C6CEC05